MGRPTQRDSVNTSRRDGVSDHDLAGVEESLAADEFASEGLMSQHSGDGWPAGSCSDEELEEAWLDDMGGRITAPYRDDRELLRDCVALTDLRQRRTGSQRGRCREDCILDHESRCSPGGYGDLVDPHDWCGNAGFDQGQNPVDDGHAESAGGSMRY